MIDFKGLRDRAQHLLAERSGTVKQGITKASGFVGGKAGHNKVDPIEQKLQDLMDKSPVRMACRRPTAI